jgi:hypothetical protein
LLACLLRGWYCVVRRAIIIHRGHDRATPAKFC